MHTYRCASMHACMYMCMCVHSYVHAHTCRYTYKCTCTQYTHTCTQTHVCSCTQYTHMCIYPYTYMHIHTPLWGRRALCGELCRLSLNTPECSTLSLTIVLCTQTPSQVWAFFRDLPVTSLRVLLERLLDLTDKTSKKLMSLVCVAADALSGSVARAGHQRAELPCPPCRSSVRPWHSLPVLEDSALCCPAHRASLLSPSSPCLSQAAATASRPGTPEPWGNKDFWDKFYY